MFLHNMQRMEIGETVQLMKCIYCHTSHVNEMGVWFEHALPSYVLITVFKLICSIPFGQLRGRVDK